MSKKLCKKCNSKMDSSTLESNDDHMFHEHLTCRNDPHHPTYCVTTREWFR